jgi:hypothetical protein
MTKCDRRVRHVGSTGKSANSCPAPCEKIFGFSDNPNCPISRRSLPGKRGDRASSRTWEGMRWTRAAPAREGIAGRISVSDPRARDTNGAACVRQKRVVLATRGWCQAGGDCESPTGLFAIVNSPATEARRIRLRGERAISRQPTAQGMPACPGCTCMLVCASSTTIAHETAGAASTRHSLLPLFGGDKVQALQDSDSLSRENAKPCPPSLRAKRSNPSRGAKKRMDCFAEPVIGRAFARPGGSQ